MIRWLATLVLGTSLLAAPTAAQVFKPKSGSSSTSKSHKSSKTRKSASRKKASSHRARRKSRAASKGRPSDLTPDDAPKVDPDYVKIIDDDE